jgi:hypothetical protein
MKRIIGISLIFSIFFSCTSKLENKNEKETDLTQDQIDSIAMIECDSLIKRLHEKGLDTIGKSSYNPKNFDECLLQLDTLINDSLKQWIRCLPDGRFGNIVHDSFGMYLRNNWGLWGETELAKNLYEMGIFHPDDMSAIILDSYQRKLKGEDIRIEEQLKYYQDYWRETGHPVDSLLEVINNDKAKE